MGRKERNQRKWVEVVNPLRKGNLLLLLLLHCQTKRSPTLLVVVVVVVVEEESNYNHHNLEEELQQDQLNLHKVHHQSKDQEERNQDNRLLHLVRLLRRVNVLHEWH